MTSDEVEKIDEPVDQANIISKQSESVEDLSSWLVQGGHSHATSTPCIPANKLPCHLDSGDSGFGPSLWGGLSQPKSQSHESRECHSCVSLDDTGTRLSSQAQINLFSQFEEKAGIEKCIAKPTLESRGRRRLTKRRSLQEIGTPSPFRSKRPLSLDREYDSGLNVTTESCAFGFETSLQYRSSFEASKEKSLAPIESDLMQTSKPLDARALEEFTLRKSKVLVSSLLKVPSSGLVSCDPPSFFSARKNVHRPVIEPRRMTFEERLAQRKMEFDREIGSRIGEEYFDILGELRQKEFYEPICLLLSYLSAEDLCRVRLVSVRWKSALDFDSTARRRRKKYLFDKRRLVAETPQENWAQITKKLTPESNFTTSSQVMGEIQAVASGSCASSAAATITKDELFRKEAQSLSRNEALRKCPRCDSPARANLEEHRALCTRPSCQFEFCISCRMSLHLGRDCVTQVRRPVEPKIGSKRSKQNLRRL